MNYWELTSRERYEEEAADLGLEGNDAEVYITRAIDAEKEAELP